MNLTVVERKTRLIGAIMVERGLLTSDQLRAALEVQAERGGLLGEIVMAEFGVSRAEVSQVIAEQLAELEGEPGSEPSSVLPPLRLSKVEPVQAGRAHLPVGDALLELGLVSRDQIDSAHAVQRESGERLGEILVGQGVISRLELADALSEHWSSLTKLRAPGVVDTPVEAAEAAPAQIPATELKALTDAVEGVGARLEETIAVRDRELTSQFERLSARLDEVAVSHEQAGSRLEAIAAAQEGGAGDQSRAEVEGLASQFERLSARLDNLVGERDVELAARFEGLSSRFDQLAALHEETGARLEAITAAPEPVGGRDPGAELEEIKSQWERLSSRLYELVGERDGELGARFDGLSARFDQLAALHEQAGSRLEAIAAAQAAGVGHESAAELEALAGQLERLSARLDELVGERDGELAARFEALSSRFDQLAGLHEETGARLEAIVAARDAAAGRDSGSELEKLPGQFERLSARLDELVGGRDVELSGQFERLSARFDELGPLHEQTGARLDAIAAAQNAGPGRESAAELEALASVMAGLEATVAERLKELSGQLERLSARFDEAAVSHEDTAAQLDAIAAAQETVVGRDGEVSGQLERLSARFDELVGGLDEASAGQLERSFARLDEVVVWREQLEARLATIAAGLEAAAGRESAGDLEALASVIEGLEASLTGRDRELSGRFEQLLSRFDDVAVLQELTGTRLEAIAAAQGGGRESAAELEALAAGLEGLEARIAGRDRELAGRFEGLSSRFDEFVVAAQAEGLVERIASLDEAQRRGEELLGRLVREVASLHAQNEATAEPSKERPTTSADPVTGPEHGSRKKAKKKKKK